MTGLETIPLFTDHLTAGENLVAIKATHLGQAHLAGTGPTGKTCRDCAKWCALDMNGKQQAHRYGGGDRRGYLALLAAKCTHPILNKADRLVPPEARACRFFVQSQSTPAEWRRDGRFKKGTPA